jgi:hypothetical protein
MNQEYKHLRALLSIITSHGALDDLIAEAMDRNGTPVSKSKLQGWRSAPDNRHYMRMSREDFNNVLTALIRYYSN